MGLADVDVKAIDAVVNIWTPEALSHRPDWKDGFFAGKVKAKSPMPGMSLEQMLERMAEAGIERGFLVAARTGLAAVVLVPLAWRSGVLGAAAARPVAVLLAAVTTSEVRRVGRVGGGERGDRSVGEHQKKEAQGLHAAHRRRPRAVAPRCRACASRNA